MRRNYVLLGCLFTLCLALDSAEAQLPADQTVQLRLRESAADPNSPVEVFVIATLEAVDVEDSDVGWSISTLEFFLVDGTETKSWIEIEPVLETSDGLWWVTHDDPESPSLNEFLTTPLLQGVAAADDPQDEDLAYEIIADIAAPSSPYQNAAIVSYALAAADTNAPVKTGDDEPVETQSTRDMD